MSRYAASFERPSGPGDARPTALQVVDDEGRRGNMNGKVFLITGCSSGIGVETARAAAATGAKVFLAVRSLERGQAACGSILEPGRVELLQLDTSSAASVRAAAAEFLRRSPILNILICNAGVMAIPEREESVDGFEKQLATNYLGHFLLFWLLKDAMLKASAPEFNSRLINVSSAGHHASEIQFDDLNLVQDGAYEAWGAYGQSKLAQIYMANLVERKYAAQGLHALSLMPGGIITNLQQYVPDEVKQAIKKHRNMAEPISLIASVAGLLDVAFRSSKVLHGLQSQLKNAPNLIRALSNEVEDIRAVLARVEDVTKASNASGHHSPTISATMIDLEAQLRKAKVTLSDLEILTNKLAAEKPTLKRIKWCLNQSRASELQSNLKEVRTKINDLLVAHNRQVLR
ncbi:hypothetical protein ACHAPT_009397 [Fusarium lateritium]